MEQICTCPVKYRHKVITDNFHSELGKVLNGFNVVCDVLITGRKTDFDVIVYIYRLNHIHIKSVRFELLLHFCNFFNCPDFPWQLVVQCPYDACHTRNLLDIGKTDFVIAFPIPTEPHLHWHKDFLLNKI